MSSELNAYLPSPGTGSAYLTPYHARHATVVCEAEATVDQRRLVERAQGGDHDAFSDLALAAIVRLDQAARLIVRDPELARDAVQDGLIRAWRDLPGLRDPDRFDVWLHRLIVNACLDIVRRRNRRVIEVELTPFRHPTGADLAGGLADRDLIASALQRLDPTRRAVVVMHYYLGMPLTDVGASLGIPIGTVKSRLHRALGEMRVTVTTDPLTSPTTSPGGQVA
jgi:RNA polymerase sigma-70 factor (ECF subfamily)